MANANFADIRIGFSSVRVIGTGTEHFALGFELHVDFHADNRDIFCHKREISSPSTIAFPFAIEKTPVRGSFFRFLRPVFFFSARRREW